MACISAALTGVAEGRVCYFLGRPGWECLVGPEEALRRAESICGMPYSGVNCEHATKFTLGPSTARSCEPPPGSGASDGPPRLASGHAHIGTPTD